MMYPCPCCGYCPTCGRRNLQPYGNPYWPYWNQPIWYQGASGTTAGLGAVLGGTTGTMQGIGGVGMQSLNLGMQQ